MAYDYLHHYEPRPRGEQPELRVPNAPCVELEHLNVDAGEIRDITFHKVPSVNLDDLCRVNDIADLLTLEEAAFIYVSPSKKRR